MTAQGSLVRLASLAITEITQASTTGLQAARLLKHTSVLQAPLQATALVLVSVQEARTMTLSVESIIWGRMLP